MQVEMNVKQLLDSKNKKKYWLAKMLETDYRFATKLIENETKSISFQMIGRLCTIFDCTPNELFTITESDNKAK